MYNLSKKMCYPIKIYWINICRSHETNVIKIAKDLIEKGLGNNYYLNEYEIHTYKIFSDKLLISGIQSIKQEMEPEELDINELKIE